MPLLDHCSESSEKVLIKWSICLNIESFCVCEGKKLLNLMLIYIYFIRPNTNVWYEILSLLRLWHWDSFCNIFYHLKAGLISLINISNTIFMTIERWFIFLHTFRIVYISFIPGPGLRTGRLSKIIQDGAELCQSQYG